MTKRRLPLFLSIFLALLTTGCKKELVCPSGEVNCGGHCAALLTDAHDCGACGHACGARSACGGGTCACAPGAVDCSGTCADLVSDPGHCGDCGISCSAPLVCSESACASGCATGLTDCGRACVDLAADPANCGACGVACPAGQTCRDSACHADLRVACYATGEVAPVAADLSAAGPRRDALGSPTALAVLGSGVYAADGYPAAGMAALPLDPRGASTFTPLPGDDLEAIVVHDGVLVVSNASSGAIAVLDPAGTVLDQIPLPDQQNFPNPHGIAFVGSTAYVALYGDGPTTGQKIAKLDFSTLAACAAPGAQSCAGSGDCASAENCVLGTCRPHCGEVAGTIDLLAVPGTADAPGLPFPSDAVASGTKVYVTLANLKLATVSCGHGCSYDAYVEPAGHGKLAIIDSATGDAVSVVDLGAACGNPGGLAAVNGTLWVACGSFSYSVAWPGRLVPVPLDAPAPGEALDASAVVPGKLAFCGGLGYLTDQATGSVLRFDPAALTVGAPVGVCPNSSYGFAWAADVACGP